MKLTSMAAAATGWALKGSHGYRAFKELTDKGDEIAQKIEAWEPSDSRATRKLTKDLISMGKDYDAQVLKSQLPGDRLGLTGYSDVQKRTLPGVAYQSMRSEQIRMRSKMFDATKGAEVPEDYSGPYLRQAAKQDAVDTGRARFSSFRRAFRDLASPGLQLEKLKAQRGIGSMTSAARTTDFLANPFADYLRDIRALNYMREIGMAKDEAGKFVHDASEVARGLRATGDVTTITDVPASRSPVRPDRAPKTVAYKPSKLAKGMRTGFKVLGGLGIIGGADEFTRVYKDVSEGDWRGALAHTLDGIVETVPGLSLANVGFASGMDDDGETTGIFDYYIGEDTSTPTTSGEDILDHYMEDD